MIVERGMQLVAIGPNGAGKSTLLWALAGMKMCICMYICVCIYVFILNMCVCIYICMCVFMHDCGERHAISGDWA